MTSLLETFRAELADAIAEHLAAIKKQSNPAHDLDLLEAVKRATKGWTITRIDYPNRDQHPLEDVAYGHRLRATLPFVPETTAEEAKRLARMEASLWAARAHVIDFDPADAAAGAYDDTDDDPGPPPERVSVNALLRQGLWWRACVSKESTTTEPIRIADMTHEHRLALLTWLRGRAKRYKEREDWHYAATPGPSGDMATAAFEAECDRQWDTPADEWFEAQPLVRALAYWTTPHAESPLTWRPMSEAPRWISPNIMARWAEPIGDDDLVEVYWSDLHHAWCAASGNGQPLVDELTEWRELYPWEQPQFTEAETDDEHCDAY